MVGGQGGWATSISSGWSDTKRAASEGGAIGIHGGARRGTPRHAAGMAMSRCAASEEIAAKREVTSEPLYA
jgi:hypothetical protein